MKYKQLKASWLHEQPGTQMLDLPAGSKAISVKMDGSMVRVLIERPEDAENAPFEQKKFHMVPDDGMVPLESQYVGTFTGRNDIYHVFQS